MRVTRIYFLIASLFLLLCQGVHAQDNYEAGFADRGQKIINLTADKYIPPNINIGDPEKYYWPRALARLSKYGTQDSIANHYIDVFHSRPPFHFTLIGLARIMYQYPFTPKMLEHKEQYLKEVFERDDSYNAWTAEGTENHINMSRTSGYLFADQAKDIIPEAGVRTDQMKQWMLDWSKRIYEVGTGEWNSDIYAGYNLIGWLNVYDFAEDQEVKAAAKAVLDYYACEIAINYSFGITGGSQMRGGGVNGKNSLTVYLAWLWFETDSTRGHPAITKNSSIIQAVHAALSKYRPPKLAIDLALKKVEEPEYYTNSKPSYCLAKPSYVKQKFFVHKNYTLGSSFDKYGGWTGASYQIVPWKLVVKRSDQFYPFEVGGNGGFYKAWIQVENATFLRL